MRTVEWLLVLAFTAVTFFLAGAVMMKKADVYRAKELERIKSGVR